MKKLIFPLVFAVIFIIFVVVYALAVLSAPAPLFLKWGIGILILLAAPTMIYVFIQRVKEFKEEEKMILVNTDFISGKTLNTISIVKGATIRSKHIGKDFMSGLKTIVGGELTAYSEMLNEARAIATKRMVDEATKLEADAVINIRYATSNVAQGAAEVMVYGTAVKFAV